MCYIVIYRIIQHHNDTIIKTHEGRKTQEEDTGRNDAGLRRRKEDFFTIIFLPLTLFVRFAFERVLETEHKLHILTPLL